MSGDIQFTERVHLDHYIFSVTTKEKENVMNKNFNKDDLKVGYVVKTRARGLYMVTRNDIDQLVMVDQYNGYMPLSEYNDDLTDSDRTSCLGSEADENYDIVEVYGYSAINGRYRSIRRRIIADDKREEPKEMTLEEVEKALGYPVKIVNK